MSGWRCLVLLWLVLAGAAEARTLDEIRTTGVLRVGVNPNFPPMSSFAASGELRGFDVDVARTVADRLGVKLELVPTEAASRVPFLVSGRIDMALGALTITPERQALIDFSVPLHSEAMGVITTAKLPVTRWEALNRSDVTLVNMRGNQSVTVLKEKLPKPQRLLVDGNADTIRAIAQGRADALVENVDFFIGFTRNYPEISWRVLPDPIFVAWCGVGVAKGNDGLRSAIDDVLRRLHGDGSIAALWKKHYGAAMTVPVSAAQLVPTAQVARAPGYRFDWSGVWRELPYLAAGAVISLQIADTLTLGAVFRPAPGLALTVDYYNIKVKGAISQLGAQVLIDTCFSTLAATSVSCQSINRDTFSGNISFVRAPLLNVAERRVQGLDVGASYGFDLPGAVSISSDGAKLALQANISWQFKNTTTAAEGLPVIDCAGYYGGACSSDSTRISPDLRAFVSIDYTSGGVSVRNQFRYIGTLDLLPGAPPSQSGTLAAETYWDISARWEFTKNFTISGGVNNLLDNQPPIMGFAAGGDSNTNPQLYDVIGRQFFVGIGVKF